MKMEKSHIVAGNHEDTLTQREICTSPIFDQQKVDNKIIQDSMMDDSGYSSTRSIKDEEGKS